jgi:phosphoribosylglycinamide formyltransferase-1
MNTDPFPFVVLISGNGSNLQALIDAVSDGSLPAQLRCVISDQPDAYGLERARRAGIPTRVVTREEHGDRESHDTALMAVIDEYQPKLVVLAGYMRILTPTFVRHYHGRMLNIHPSLLPNLRGLHTHQRALDAGYREHGASVHFVTEELDGGPLILQARVPVLEGDDAATLAARVLEQEHIIYPLVVRWFAQGRLSIAGDQVWMDGAPLPGPLQLGEEPAIP